MRLGYCANAWGGVFGHPVGVTSLKDSFYLTPGDTLATLREVAAAGYEGVELFDGNVAEFAGELGTLRAGLEDAGLALVGIYTGANLVYPEILGDELWRIRQASRWAAELGAEHLVVGGGAQRAEPPTDSDYANLAAALDEIVAIADGDGVTASFHPHLTTIAESPGQVARVFEASRIAFCPDTGHLQAGGGDPVELIRDHRDRIRYVHIKDLDESGGFVPLGEGVLDVAGVVAALGEIGFDGWLTVEADGWQGDPGAGARTSRRVLAELLG
ncbi:MAG: sugar phosphate isomerase/epimerase family protein [Solirubrobacterales bacterium]